jgi:UDP-glucose 4-epimerase
MAAKPPKKPATPTKKQTAKKQTTKTKKKKKQPASSKPAKPAKALPETSARVVAVTGAFGFLGRKVLARLEADPDVDRVVAIDVRSGAVLDDDDDPGAVVAAHPKLSAHAVDLTAPGAEREVADILANEGAQGLLHLAFLSTPTHALETAHELETVGTHYILNAAASTGISRLVSLSSTMCYGARPDNPAFLTEEAPLRPPPSRSLRDKASADEQVRRFAAEHPGKDVAVARLGAMVPTAPDHIWTRLFSRPVVPAVLGYDPLLQLLHPDDGAGALYALWQARARGAYNVVGASQLPLSHILTNLKRVPLYLPARLGQSLVAALWSAQLVEMPQHFFGFLRWPWLCDDKKVRAAIGFKPQHDITSVLNLLAAAKEAT